MAAYPGKRDKRSGAGPTMLTEARLAKDLSQQDLATILGVHHFSVSSWETGRFRPEPETCIRIAEALGMNKGEFLKAMRPEMANIADALNQ